MKSKIMSRVMCANGAGLDTVWSRSVAFTGAVLCAILLSSIANASFTVTQWRESPISSNPGFTENAVAAVNQYSWDYDSYNIYAFAVPGTYRLYDSSTVTVYSTDKVDNDFYENYYADPSSYPSFYMVARASMSLWVGTQISQSKGLIKGVTVEFICQNEVFSSGYEVDVVYCPEGGFPLYAEAWYTHGLKQR